MTLDTENKTTVNVKGVDADLWAKVRADAREKQVYVGTMLSYILRAHYYPHVLHPRSIEPAFETLVGALEQIPQTQYETVEQAEYMPQIEAAMGVAAAPVKPKRTTLAQFKEMCQAPKPYKDMTRDELEAEQHRLCLFEPSQDDGKKRIEIWDASMGPLSFYLNKARKAEKGKQ